MDDYDDEYTTTAMMIMAWLYAIVNVDNMEMKWIYLPFILLGAVNLNMNLVEQHTHTQQFMCLTLTSFISETNA